MKVWPTAGDCMYTGLIAYCTAYQKDFILPYQEHCTLQPLHPAALLQAWKSWLAHCWCLRRCLGIVCILALLLHTKSTAYSTHYMLHTKSTAYFNHCKSWLAHCRCLRQGSRIVLPLCKHILQPPSPLTCPHPHLHIFISCTNPSHSFLSSSTSLFSYWLAYQEH